ncbi:putative ribonuclease H-like domain-containing protein [Tanacetum coccineum]
MTHPHPKGNFVPKAVLMKSGLKTLNTARQNSLKAAVSINTAKPISTAFPRLTVNCARSASNVFDRAHSHVIMPFNKFTTNKNSNFNEKVNTIKGNITTARLKAVVSDNKGNKANVVKASACWEELKDKGVINSGCFRHMTGNRSYFINYEEINGGFVAFGGSTKGGKITRKGKIRNGKLDIEVVYFVKELKFNLFSVSQMCDKKNNVLFTDTECVVLSPDFKLTDESHVLLKVPRKDNMYSIDLKNDDTLPIADLDADAEVTLIDETQVRNDEDLISIPVSAADPVTTADKVVIAASVDITTVSAPTTAIDELTMGEEEKTDAKHLEPKKVIQALSDPSWIEAMHDELLQFKLQKVYRNKKDERGIVIRNKARLVAQGYTIEEGIDYDEVFALVARIEAIRLFLAYASFKDFVVYQMDVKSAFLYGKIEEEVYVCQPLGFEDPEFPDRVYKVEKALYGLHQAPRAWYETLSTYLLDNGFKRGQIDKTFFIKKIKGDILLVQVYVDDIIFESTKKVLRLQVTQKDDGIFISQDKYVDEILKKFGFSTVKTASTPMETSKPLLKDAEAEDVDVHLYRSMIGLLMYLTASRPDIIYLKGQPKLGLWYPKDSLLDMEDDTDSDYAGASLDRKSTTGEYVAASSCRGQVEVGEGLGNPTEPQHTSTTTLLSTHGPITVLSLS